MAGLAAKHAEVVVKTALAFLLHEFAIFADFRREVGFGGRFATGLSVLRHLTARSGGGCRSGRGFGEGGFLGCLLGRLGGGRGSWLSLLAKFRLALPVACIDGLGKVMEGVK